MVVLEATARFAGVSKGNMKVSKACAILLALVAVGSLVGCSTRSTKAAAVSASIRTSLDRAGLKDVSASQDRDNRVITLGGHVAADGDRSQAESIARALAGDEIVSNRIAVIPTGAESERDKRIGSDLEAALIRDRLSERVHYAVKNSVVTLTGRVDTRSQRAWAETVAAGVPNVLQVVNELRIRGQKIWRIDRNVQ